jgi:inhibitor of the pro-sigma K processing machinery
MLVWIMAGVSAAAVSLAACAQRHPLRRAGLSALCGCCALGLVKVLTAYTGVGIALNHASAFVASVLGIPGVVLLLALRLFVG